MHAEWSAYGLDVFGDHFTYFHGLFDATSGQNVFKKAQLMQSKAQPPATCRVPSSQC